MAIKFDPSLHLDVDIRVGNAFECRVHVFLYGEDRHLIRGKDGDAQCILWADDDDAPEYRIEKKILGANKRLRIVHVYKAGQIGTGTFSAITSFQQDGRKSQFLAVPPRDVAMGEWISQAMRLEAA